MNKIIITLAITLLSHFSTLSQTKEFSVEVIGKGTPVFLIPGLGCDKTVWDDTIIYLKENYECHTFTLAGFAGQKPLDTKLHMNQIKNALEKYIEEHSKNDAILIGHSIGGFYGLQIAIDLQEKINKLIVVDALPFWAKALNPSASEEELNAVSIEESIVPYLNMSDDNFKSQQEFTINTMLKNEEYKETVVQWSVDSDRKAFATAFQELFRKDLRDDIEKITAKTLILGAYDGVPAYAPNHTYEVAKNTYVKQYEKLKNIEIKVIKNSKHFIMYDQKEVFLKEIDTFIK